MSDARFEQQSLRAAKWANLSMGVIGVSVAVLSNASALMLDGLFSAVNFLAAVFASRVSQSVERAPDAMRPWGYEIDESVYVMFRSLVLIGIIALAALNAGNKILIYILEGDAQEIKLNWVVVYAVTMVVACLALAVWHHRNWLKTERRSALLKTERNSAAIDGTMSLSAGLAFVVIAMLKGTALGFLVPVADSIVVLGLSIYTLPQPIRMFRGSMKEILGETAPEPVRAKLLESAKAALVNHPFALTDLVVTKTGRALFVVASVRPETRVSGEEMDRIRDRVRACADKAIDGYLLRVQCLFTNEANLPSLQNRCSSNQERDRLSTRPTDQDARSS